MPARCSRRAVYGHESKLPARLEFRPAAERPRISASADVPALAGGEILRDGERYALLVARISGDADARDDVVMRRMNGEVLRAPREHGGSGREEKMVGERPSFTKVR